MDSDLKFILLIVLIIVGGPMIGMAIDDHHKNQCRLAAIQAGKNSVDIRDICK